MRTARLPIAQANVRHLRYATARTRRTTGNAFAVAAMAIATPLLDLSPSRMPTIAYVVARATSGVIVLNLIRHSIAVENRITTETTCHPGWWFFQITRKMIGLRSRAPMRLFTWTRFANGMGTQRAPRTIAPGVRGVRFGPSYSVSGAEGVY